MVVHRENNQYRRGGSFVAAFVFHKPMGDVTMTTTPFYIVCAASGACLAIQNNRCSQKQLFSASWGLNFKKLGLLQEWYVM